MAWLDGEELHWRKSSTSAAGGECVEVAVTDVAVMVRDSKDRSGPVLKFSHAEWRAFVTGIIQGEFSLTPE